MKTNGKQSAAFLPAGRLLCRRHGNSVFCGGQFAGLYSQRATQTAQQPTPNGVHIRQKAPLLFFAQIAIQGNHAVKVESGGVKPIPMRDHVGGTVTRRSVGLAVVGVILVKICLCALPNDGAQRRACIHAVADINRAVLGNILRLDAVRQTIRDLDRHRAALDGRGDQFIHLVVGGRWHRSAARLCNVEHLADIIPGSLSAVILVHLPHNGRVTFLAGTDKIDNIKFKREKEKALTDMEIEMMRQACQTTMQKAIMEMLLSTGCRAAELVSIKIADMDEDKVSILGKGGKWRTVYINAKAFVAVKNYLADRKDTNPYLFPREINTKDRTMISNFSRKDWFKDPRLVTKADHFGRDSVNNMVRTIGKRAGVKGVHTHRFRRTCATQALRHGMPIELVSMMLGHEQISTTQIYLDIRDDDLQAAHRKYVV